MTSRALRQDDDQHNHCGRDGRRGQRAAQCEAAVGDGLVDEIAHGCAQRPCQDESDPKQGDVRRPGPVIEGHDNRERSGEYQRASLVSKSACVGKPVARRGAQRLRKRDGCPVERLAFWRRNSAHSYRALRPPPASQRRQQTTQKQKVTAGTLVNACFEPSSANKFRPHVKSVGIEGWWCSTIMRVLTALLTLAALRKRRETAPRADAINTVGVSAGHQLRRMPSMRPRWSRSRACRRSARWAVTLCEAAADRSAGRR